MWGDRSVPEVDWSSEGRRRRNVPGESRNVGDRFEREVGVLEGPGTWFVFDIS